jgi:hypothetical protein
MKTCIVDLNDDSLIEQLAAMAQHNEDVGADVMQLLAESDVVLGLFPDLESPRGFGAIPVKGYHRLKQGCGTARITAVKCRDLEAACELGKLCGTWARIN